MAVQVELLPNLYFLWIAFFGIELFLDSSQERVASHLWIEANLRNRLWIGR